MASAAINDIGQQVPIVVGSTDLVAVGVERVRKATGNVVAVLGDDGSGAVPIRDQGGGAATAILILRDLAVGVGRRGELPDRVVTIPGDRKSTRLNSSHANISYAV